MLGTGTETKYVFLIMSPSPSPPKDTALAPKSTQLPTGFSSRRHSRGVPCQPCVQIRARHS